MSVDITPEELARYDQAFANSEAMLFGLVANYQIIRTEDAGKDIPEAITIVALAKHLAEHWEAEHTASALAAAVVLMHRLAVSVEHVHD